MLHLATLNEKKEMFDRLIELGADPMLRNNDGLTAFTLSVRFSLWGMFRHIWNRHFSKAYWSFGNVAANFVDYQQFEAVSNGMGAFGSVHEIDRCINALVYRYIQHPGYNANKSDNHENPRANDNHTKHREQIKHSISSYCQRKLSSYLSYLNSQRESQIVGMLEKQESMNWQKNERLQYKSYGDAKSAVQLITHFRPEGWYANTKELMEEVVSLKWSHGYYLVHIADSLIPFCVIILIFCLMWWQRQLNVLEHNFWWAEGPISAPNPNSGIEGACGWSAMRDSNSGRLQAVLASYGVISLLRLARIQSRLRPTDLDENIDWKISTDELIQFLYVNLESILHTIAAGLFLTIFFSRGAAGDACSIDFVRTEKNCTSIAALALFFNLFIVCKPYKGFGLLVLTWYQFLLSEVFNFLVMYGMIFTAFLIALQTVHNANYAYLMWMDQTDSIFPQVQQAIGKLYPNASSETSLTYLQNTNPTSANLLLTSDVQLNGCYNFRRSLADTAFTLLEVSFGDGLADSLEQARYRPYECAGFNPDNITVYLVILWVFVTNVLILNMLIAIMTDTLDEQREKLSSVWLIDISKRVLRYDHFFPELAPRMARPVQRNSFFSRTYVYARLDDLRLILYCIPEFHFVLKILHLLHAMQASSDLQQPWKNIKDAILKYEDMLGIKSENFNCWNSLLFILHPHSTALRRIYGIDLKAAQFGQLACKTLMENDMLINVNDQQWLIHLIPLLEKLKQTLQNSKLKLSPRTGSKSANADKPTAGEEQESASSICTSDPVQRSRSTTIMWGSG